MKGLLYKDILSVYRSYRSFFMIVAVFLIVSLFNDNASYWASYAVFMTCAMVSTMQNTDEATQWAFTCDTFPMKRKIQVDAKFLLSILLTLSVMVTYAVIAFLASLFGIGSGVKWLGMNLILMLITGCLGTALSLTPAFLFGPQKSQMMRIVFIAIFVFAGMILINYTESLAEILSGMSGKMIAMLIIAGSLLLVLLARWISTVCYEKRTLQ